MSNKGTSVGRRTAIKLLGGATIVSTGRTVTAAKNSDSNDYSVARLRGSYENPVSLEEAHSRLEQLVNMSSNADQSLLADQAIPEFDPRSEIVEYVARIDPNGNLSQYYGAAGEKSEDDAHDRADKKEVEFGENAVTSDTDAGPDWDYVKDDQASDTAHFGGLVNNLEWYRERDDDQERNAFRQKIAGSDDTIQNYNRSLHARHDWGVSDLGNESIHEADPDTTDGSPIEVSVGLPPQLQLSWSFGGSGSITHNLDPGVPKAQWTRDLPKSGTVWCHPGSHVVSDKASCGNEQDVVQLKAKATWGGYVKVYDLVHKWNVYTGTCT